MSKKQECGGQRWVREPSLLILSWAAPEETYEHWLFALCLPNPCLEGSVRVAWQHHYSYT